MPSTTFTYTGAVQQWQVPANVVNITIEVWGAEGGRVDTGVTRRYGGYAKGNLSVTPGETLNLYVGQRPGTGVRAGGWNGGGDGGQHFDFDMHASGGGGATDVRQGGTALSNRVIVGAGAGGSTSVDGVATPPEGIFRGGHGGANTGERGDGPSGEGVEGGYGGSQTAGGDNGGTSGNGGDGFGGMATNDGPTGSGGGGGGGYYGGGGGDEGTVIVGEFGNFTTNGRGGGGGSNYTGGVTSASSTRGVRAGHGQIKITYTQPPNPPTDVTPVSGATVNTDVPTLGATIQEHPESSTIKSRAEWQLAADSGFTSNVRTITEPTSDLRASGSTTEKVPDADQLFQGTWFIRARAIDEGGNFSDWTAGHSFTVSHPPTTTGHSPTGGNTLDYGADGAVTFSWTFSDSSEVDDQTAFEIEVSRNSDGFILLAPGKQASTDESEVLNIPDTEKDITLRWRIRVWDSDDVVGSWSDYHLFKVSDPPTAAITTPALKNQLTNHSFETGDLTGWATLVEGTSTVTVVADAAATDGDNVVELANTETTAATELKQQVAAAEGDVFELSADIVAHTGSAIEYAIRAYDSGGVLISTIATGAFSTLARHEVTSSAAPAGTANVEAVFRVNTADTATVRLDNVFFADTSVGNDVNNAQPTFTWDFVASGGRTQASFRVIVREGAVEVYNSGSKSSSATSYQLTAPVLENSKNYDLEVRVTDNVNLQGSGFRNFDTVWIPPPAPPATVTDHTPTLGYISVEWDNSNQDPDFISYSVYRRVDGGSWVRVLTVTEIQTTYDYHDWLVEIGRSYEYAVTQTADVDGDVLESEIEPIGPVVPSSDKYWLISEEDESLNLQLRHVTADDFSEAYEQSETTVIGRGRHVDEGERQGFSGSLSAQLRDIPAGDTAREQREKILDMKGLQQAVYLRNPFGDLWLVSIGNVEFTRVAGVSTREFSDVSVPYTEVA